MAVVPAERVSWIVVEFDAGKTPAAQTQPAQTASTAPPAPGPPDPNAVQVVVIPPHAAAAEAITLKPDLSDAAAVLPRAVQTGYFIHGDGYFDAIQVAVRGRRGRAGGPQWLTNLTEAQRGQLGEFVARAITDERQRIAKAVLAVQAKAAELALKRLEESLANIVASAIRYISQASDESRAKAWLKVKDLDGGARTILFNEGESLDLLDSIFVLRTYFLEFVKKDAALASARKRAGPEMQRIVGSRYTWLRDKDPKNTPNPKATISSKDYGVELMDTSNPARPDLVARAKELFPDPAGVTAAREKMLKASAAFTSTMVDEGEVHPILYRIWSPALADALYHEQSSIGSMRTAKIFDSVSRFRVAISESLRSAYAAANSLHDKIKGDAAAVWKYPLLINAAVEAMGLAEDAYPRVVAEHTLAAAAEAEERVQKAFMRTSEVLLATQMAIRFVPAPEGTVPVALVLGVLDTVVGGIALLYQYFAESATRDAYRAFLSPADCFAASDGSYIGIVIGAAFLLFGTLGLKRATLTVPSKSEVGMAVAGFGVAEYLGARGKSQ
jgi:hypothetical protein